MFFEPFPDTDGVNTVTIDKAPSYFQLPGGPDLVKKYWPGSKVVLTLCDPAERLFSEFHHCHRDETIEKLFNTTFIRKNIPPPTTFEDFVDVITEKSPVCTENENPNICKSFNERWWTKGNYIENLQRWNQAFSKDEMLILDMNAPPKENTERMIKFAGLPLDEYPWHELEDVSPSYSNTQYSGREAAWEESPESMKLLANHFAPLNKELASFIGHDFPLQWKSTSS